MPKDLGNGVALLDENEMSPAGKSLGNGVFLLDEPAKGRDLGSGVTLLDDVASSVKDTYGDILKMGVRGAMALVGPGTAMGEVVSPNARARSPRESPPIVNFRALEPERLVPGAGPVSQAAKGVVQGVADVATSLTTPTNAMILAATGGLGLIASPPVRAAVTRLVHAGFSVDMLHTAVQQVPEFKEMVKQGDVQGATRVLTSIGGSAAFSVGAARGALGGMELERPGTFRGPVAPATPAERYSDGLARASNEQLANFDGTTPADVAAINREIATRMKADIFDVPHPPAERAAKPVVPETGISEAEARLAEARENLAQQYTGKPVAELTPDEFMFVDAEARKGNGSAQAVQPVVAPPTEPVARPQAVQPPQAPAIEPAPAESSAAKLRGDLVHPGEKLGAEDRQVLAELGQREIARSLDLDPDKLTESQRDTIHKLAQEEGYGRVIRKLKASPEPVAPPVAASSAVAPARPAEAPVAPAPAAVAPEVRPEPEPVTAKPAEVAPVEVPPPPAVVAPSTLKEAPATEPAATKEPWQVTRAEYVAQNQKGPEVREDYASAWTPVKQRGASDTIEFTPYKGAKKAGVYRWNDKEGIGRGVVVVDEAGKISDLAVQKQWRNKGIAQELLNRARADGFSGVGSPENTPQGLRSIHRNEVSAALSEGKPVPPAVLADYPDLAPKPEAPPTPAPPKSLVREDAQGITDEMQGAERFYDMTPAQREAALPDIVRNTNSGTAQDRAFARGWLNQQRKAKESAPTPLQAAVAKREAKVAEIKAKAEEPAPAEKPTPAAQPAEPQSTGEYVESKPVFGHPTNSPFGPKEVEGIIPLKVNGKTDLSWRFRDVQKVVDELQSKIGRADAISKRRIKATPKDLKDAKAYLQSANYRSDAELLGALREETLPELNRLSKIVESQAPAAQPEPVSAATARIKQSLTSERGSISAKTTEPLFDDLVTVGAHYLSTAAKTFKEWSARMVQDFGDAIRPLLARVFAAARNINLGSERGSFSRRPTADERRVTVNRPAPVQAAVLPKRTAAAEAAVPPRRVATVEAAAPVAPRQKPLVASPSYYKTRENILKHLDVSPESKNQFAKNMDEWEAKHPEDRLRVVSHEEVRAEAALLDPSLIRDLKMPKAGETLPRAVWEGARGAENSLNAEIVRRSTELASKIGGMDPVKIMAEEQTLARLRKDAQNMRDILTAVRSQDGRNLSYYNSLAKAGFDVGHWIGRAKSAAGGVLDNATEIELRKILDEGQEAQEAATQRVYKKRAAETTREQAVEEARKALASRLRSALRDLKATADPVTPNEKLAWESDPEIQQLRSALDLKRQVDAQWKASHRNRAEEVEAARLALISRLEATLAGKKSSTNPVSPEERLAFETDSKVQDLRRQIEEKQKREAVPVTSEMRVDRGVERSVEHLEDKAAGNVKKPGEWALTPEERKLVDQDPRVLEARRKLAKTMMTVEKSGPMETAISVIKAGLLTGPKTHVRNIVGTTGFQVVLEEAARFPGAALDMVFGAGRYVAGKGYRRTVQGISPMAMAKAGKEAGTRGVREAGEIWKHGATQDQLAALDHFKELNSGSKVVDTYVRTVFRTLAMEDQIQRVYGFERSIQEQMALAKVKTPTEAMKEQAILDAEYSTFNNSNNPMYLGWQRLKSVRQYGPGGRALAYGMDIIVPFSRTPANITARIIDYTPVGMIGRMGVETIKAARNKTFTAEQQRLISRAFGRGVVGSALIYAGWKLAEAGLMTGTAEDQPSQRASSEVAGRMPGSVLIGGEWQSFVSASPMGNVMAIGATMYREAHKPLKDEARRPLTMLKHALRTVKEQPMMSGLNAASGAMDQPSGRLENFAGRTAGMIVPTAASDVAGLFDTKRRETESDGIIDAMIKGIQVKVPGARNQLPEHLDVLGRTQPQNKMAAVNPGIGSKAKELTDPIARELIQQKVGVSHIKPKVGEKPDEFRLRREVTGKVIEAELRDVVESNAYQDLPQLSSGDESRRLMLQKAVAKARGEINRVVNRDEYKEANRNERAALLRDLLDR